MILFGKNIPILFSLAIWFIVWELIGHAKLSTIIPPFSAVLAAGITIVPTAKFSAAVSISLRSFAVGMALALAIGIPLGVVMREWRRLEKSSACGQYFCQRAHFCAGTGAHGGHRHWRDHRSDHGFLFAVFVIILDTKVGIQQADRSLVEMARCFGARPYQVYTKVLFLCALPEILAGVRLGAIRGVKGVVIGQLLIAILGVGELFELYSQHFLMEEFWALVIIVFMFAFTVSECVAFLERRVDYYASTR
jgi:NitT/TauT family transport system permease protein